MSRKFRNTCAAALMTGLRVAGIGMAAFGIVAFGDTFAASATEPGWIRQFGTGLDDYARAVATSPDGRVHVVGLTFGHFGAAKSTSKDDADAFVITFDRNGTELWRRQPGTSNWDSAEGVATDADGNVYVVGETIGRLGGAKKGSSDVFVIKFDRDGQIVWKRQPGTREWDTAFGVAAHADGTVFVVGETDAALAGPYKGSSDAFVISFDRDGQYRWKRQPGTSGFDAAFGIAAGPDGNITVAGDTDGRLGGFYKGGSDAFVVNYGPDGRTLWTRQPGTIEWDNAQGVATDPYGSIYLVGRTEFSLGGRNKGYDDAYVIKYDAHGRNQWRDQPGTTGSDEATGVATDRYGNVFVVGNTAGPLGGTDKGFGDAFVISYDRNGHILWSDQPGTSTYDSAVGVATDTSGNVYVLGNTWGSMPHTARQGGQDAFLIKYATVNVQ